MMRKAEIEIIKMGLLKKLNKRIVIYCYNNEMSIQDFVSYAIYKFLIIYNIINLLSWERDKPRYFHLCFHKINFITEVSHKSITPRCAVVRPQEN